MGVDVERLAGAEARAMRDSVFLTGFGEAESEVGKGEECMWSAGSRPSTVPLEGRSPHSHLPSHPS